MTDSPVQVHPWPQAQTQAVQTLQHTGLLIIGVAMPDVPRREVARTRLRAAVAACISVCFQVPAASVRLRAQPGAPLVWDTVDHPLGLSVSHADGLSVAALHTHGAVGIDLMRVDSQVVPDWAHLAHDYLGPQAQSRLHNTEDAARAAAFAQEWTGMEARLKWAGLALTEWTPALAQTLAACNTHTLAWPAPQGTPWCASVAI